MQYRYLGVAHGTAHIPAQTTVIPQAFATGAGPTIVVTHTQHTPAHNERTTRVQLVEQPARCAPSTTYPPVGPRIVGTLYFD